MVRPFYLLFSIASYLIFFATFLYLIGFVADFVLVEHSVDNGPVGSVGRAVAVDIALIALFGLQHSVMARQGFKAAWTRIVPPPIERSVYVLFSSLALIVMFSFWRPIPTVIWRVDDIVGATLIWAIFGIGWLMVLLSTFLISHFELFGLKQAVLHLMNRPERRPRFRQPFFYKLMRHPLYSGFLLAFWATPLMTAGHLLLAIGMTVYILVAIRYEERDLVALFGADYRAYQRNVGMLAPRLRRGSRA